MEQNIKLLETMTFSKNIVSLIAFNHLFDTTGFRWLQSYNQMKIINHNKTQLCLFTKSRKC